jgi:hypothetical protein
MSIKYMSLVYAKYDGPPLRKFLLLTLCDFANDDGFCWPSGKTLARKCNMSLSTVRGHLAALRDEGILTAHGFAGENYKASRRYHITLPSGIRTGSEIRTRPELPPTPVRNPDHPRPDTGPNPSGNHQEPPGGHDGAPRAPFQPVKTAGIAPDAPAGSSLEKKREKAKREAAMFKALARLGMAVSSPADREAWKGLLLKVRPQTPEEAAGIVARCVDQYREATGRELRWPSEARTWIERAAAAYRKEEA